MVFMSEIINGLTLPNAPQAIEFDVAERTALAVATFDSLGFVRDKGAATEAIEQKMQKLQISITESPATAVEPFIAIELTDKFSVTALKEAFDAKIQGENNCDTYVYQKLWDQYSPAELNSRRVGQKATTVAQGIKVLGEARAMVLGNEGNTYSEAGLYHTDQNLKNQIEAVKDLGLINPVDYIILQAQRREAGETPLDTNTFTRFVQLDKKSAGGFSGVPDARWGGDRLRLDGSGALAVSDVGVRLSVGSEA